MSDDLVAVHVVKMIRKDKSWPKFRLINGQFQRIMSEDSVPEYLYQDEQTTEWRELRE